MKWRVIGRWVLLLSVLRWNLLLRAQDEIHSSASLPVDTVNSAIPKVDLRQDDREPGEERFTLVPGDDPENRFISPFVKHIAGDQAQFWTSPVRLPGEGYEVDRALCRGSGGLDCQRFLDGQTGPG